MIAQKFEYTAPKSLDEALHLLASGAKPLAGGMSLIPMMKLRLAAPEHLVDLRALRDLNYIREAGGFEHFHAECPHQLPLPGAMPRRDSPYASPRSESPMTIGPAISASSSSSGVANIPSRNARNTPYSM